MSAGADGRPRPACSMLYMPCNAASAQVNYIVDIMSATKWYDINIIDIIYINININSDMIDTNDYKDIWPDSII